MLITQIDTKYLNKTSRGIYLRELKAAKIDTVLLSFCEFFADGERRQAALESLGDNISFFTNAGFSVAVWTNSLGYGVVRDADFTRRFQSSARLTSFDGGTSSAVCTLDRAFSEYMKQNTRDIIRAGAKTVLWDDDLVQSVRPGFCCTCPEHLKAFERKTGRAWTAAQVRELFTGKPNANRSAYLDLMGESITDFCVGLRAAADEVDPSARMGLCASFTHYDIEGVDIRDLVRSLAGAGNRPLLRLSGAPYWAAFARRYPTQTLGDIAEFVRMQAGWLAGEDIELFDENDPYPRQQRIVPAAYTELYDKLIFTSSAVGRHKYIMTYDALDENADRSYLNAHIRDLPDDLKLISMFSGKTPLGFRVYQTEHTLRGTELPDAYIGDGAIMARFSQPFGGIFLQRNSIPTRYAGEGVGIVCGEQARYLTEEQKKRGGLLLDIKAAELLAREGIDVGLSSAADVLSRKNEEKADEPRLWTYENAEKRKYAVLNYDIGSALPNASPDSVELSDVPLQRALAEAYEFLSGSPLPAFALGCPGLYLLACGDKEKLSLLLCNIFPDGIQNPDIFLDGEYRVKRELRAQARTEGNRLLLSRLPAYSYAAVELIKE